MAAMADIVVTADRPDHTAAAAASPPRDEGIAMACEFQRLMLWSVRAWFASTRSLRELAPIELAWLERGIGIAWPAFANWLSIVDCERTRDLDVRSPRRDAGRARESVAPTVDESALLAALALAGWDRRAAARRLRGFLGDESAAAAARAAARVRNYGVGGA